MRFKSCTHNVEAARTSSSQLADIRDFNVRHGVEGTSHDLEMGEVF